jgi:hypothetical protein
MKLQLIAYRCLYAWGYTSWTYTFRETDAETLDEFCNWIAERHNDSDKFRRVEAKEVPTPSLDMVAVALKRYRSVIKNAQQHLKALKTFTTVGGYDADGRRLSGRTFAPLGVMLSIVEHLAEPGVFYVERTPRDASYDAFVNYRERGKFLGHGPFKLNDPRFRPVKKAKA